MVRATIITFVSNIILFVLSMASAIVLARLLGPEKRGILAVVMSLVGLLSLIGEMGIGMSNVYFAGQKLYHISTLIWNSLIMGFGASILLVAISGVLYLFIPSLLQGISGYLILLGVLSIPFSLSSGHLNNLLRGMQRFGAFNMLTIVIRIFMAGGNIIFLLLYPEVKTALIVALATGLLGLVIHLGYFIWKLRISLLNATYKIEALYRSFSFGLKGHLGNIMQVSAGQLTILLLNYLSGPVAVGIYAIATTLQGVLGYINLSVVTVLFPTVASLKNLEESARLAAKSCRICLYLTILSAMVLMVLSPWLVPLLFGKEFIGAILPFHLLALSAVIFVFTNVLAGYIAGRGFPHYNALISTIFFILTTGLNLLLIPISGITGAAITALISSVVSAILTMYFYKRLSHSSLKDLIIPEMGDWITIKNILR